MPGDCEPFPAMPTDPRDAAIPWYNRLNVVNVTFLIFLLAAGASLPALEG